MSVCVCESFTIILNVLLGFNSVSVVVSVVVVSVSVSCC